MKERIIVTGANGQLGKQMVEELSPDLYEVYPFDKNGLDITNMSQVMYILKQIHPHVIIHCAAYTKVDAAEEEEDLAYLVNAIGTRNVAVVAQNLGAKFVYISTDYVFPGDKVNGYHEFHQPAPINIYGASKYAGEQFVKDLHNQYFIIRTSWLYGKYGNNFVKTMIRLGEEKESLSIVADQVGSPTYVKNLIAVIKNLIDTSLYGTYHVSNSGSCSWYEFAKEIFSQSNKQVKILPVSTEEFGAKAPRPKYSIFQHRMLHLNGFSQMPSWEEGLESFFIETKSH
ncbi:dTDP-4-dehydrorhamnose reductase [Bacillus toyonensis]|uniref:dTDP-4-dehydrorhamnose reductase n=1 Tax=Bacillus toyonensis TaxID=155322 RepID=UPI0018A13693|nr:dTDP-4-dehydrorhamnose reductase [Bacillus toyonensis]MBF7145253.1 dTDP-4-dehydrorhamnose reductase [Bacillus toyonensis]MEC2349264.1 dTDP-4-dehydrorhamnose reductase [Bacillus toyonensis]MED3184987.1 dTDP-4-dehydrorhamnose reductase [Bacillus toyonensis]